MNDEAMIRAGLIGVGKMGISHYAILGAQPGVTVAALCDNATYVTSALRKHTGVETYKDYKKMIEGAALDCVFVATPSSTHYEAAAYALEKGLHVFVEKPLCLEPDDSRKLADLAHARGRINQVGYHNRFIGTFREVRRLVKSGTIGDVHHIAGSAFGQVVIRPKTGNTWRTKKSEGGGCLHDYASHVIDLMNFVVGPPAEVVAAQLQSIYSQGVEDAVYAMFRYANGATGALETNWSDETHRKMSTTLVIQGTKGKIVADRQECRVFLKPGADVDGYPAGWTIRYITDLQEPVAFYLRGEEYSAQIEAFIGSIRGVKQGQSAASEHGFASAFETDKVVDAIMKRAQGRN